MAFEFFIRIIGIIIFFGPALGCAIYLYWFSLKKANAPPLITTVLVIGVTALISSLQFAFPDILSELRRNRAALLAGEWWRMITPLFVQAGGWTQCCFNGVAALTFCPVAEKLYGKRLLALYFVPGVLGEIFAYMWSPNGSGSSLGIAGVMGSLFAFPFLHRQEMSTLVRIFAILGFVEAFALCVFQNTHGPPMFIGALVASLMTKLWPNTALEPTPTAP